jgi:hypothetical protein
MGYMVALPPQQNESGNAVQSASSSRSAGGATTTSPITVQYFAPSTKLSYISEGGPGSDHPPDPSTDPLVITITCGDTSFTGDVTADIIAAWFTATIVETFNAQEIVAGQFWLNTVTKILVLQPFIFTVSSGAYLSLASPGGGYTAGDTLTVTVSAESATVVVDTVGSIFGTGGGILSWHTTANTFTAAHTFVSATGGTGSGAKFNVFIVP